MLSDHFNLCQSWQARVSFIMMPMCICVMQLSGRRRLLLLTNTGGANIRVQI